MNQRRMLLIVLSLTLMLTATIATAAASQSRPAASIDLSWNTMNSSGGYASSASYSIEATLGQPFTGLSTSVATHLSAGFWQMDSADYRVFLPIVLK